MGLREIKMILENATKMSQTEKKEGATYWKY